MEGLHDPRFKGFEKLEHHHTTAGGEYIEVHYVKNPKSRELMDFKFKDNPNKTPQLYNMLNDMGL